MHTVWPASLDCPFLIPFRLSLTFIYHLFSLVHHYFRIINVNGFDSLNHIVVEYNKFIKTDSSETTCTFIMIVSPQHKN